MLLEQGLQLRLRPSPVGLRCGLHTQVTPVDDVLLAVLDERIDAAVPRVALDAVEVLARQVLLLVEAEGASARARVLAQAAAERVYLRKKHREAVIYYCRNLQPLIHVAVFGGCP